MKPFKLDENTRELLKRILAKYMGDALREEAGDTVLMLKFQDIIDFADGYVEEVARQLSEGTMPKELTTIAPPNVSSEGRIGLSHSKE